MVEATGFAITTLQNRGSFKRECATSIVASLLDVRLYPPVPWQMPVALCGLRFFANLFRHRGSRKVLLANASTVLDAVSDQVCVLVLYCAGSIRLPICTCIMRGSMLDL